MLKRNLVVYIYLSKSYFKINGVKYRIPFYGLLNEKSYQETFLSGLKSAKISSLINYVVLHLDNSICEKKRLKLLTKFDLILLSFKSRYSDRLGQFLNVNLHLYGREPIKQFLISWHKSILYYFFVIVFLFQSLGYIWVNQQKTTLDNKLTTLKSEQKIHDKNLQNQQKTYRQNIFDHNDTFWSVSTLLASVQGRVVSLDIHDMNINFLCYFSFNQYKFEKERLINALSQLEFEGEIKLIENHAKFLLVEGRFKK